MVAIREKCQTGSIFLSCPSYVSWLRQLMFLHSRELLTRRAVAATYLSTAIVAGCLHERSSDSS